jgi:HK97 family phage portal protein
MTPTRRIMSPDDYRADSISTNSPSAGRPAPTDVMDGRFFGDEIWALLDGAASAETADAAAKVSAVYFCVSIIAETLGSLSLDVFEGDRPARDLPIADTLAYEPNPLQTGAEFWSAMTFAAMLHGRCYAEPVLNSDGELELWPLPPGSYSEEWGHRSLSVIYSPDGGQAPRRLGLGSLFWFSGLTGGGLQPLTPWKMAKGSIDFALAIEKQGRDFFRNAARPAGMLSAEAKISAESKQDIEDGVRKWKAGGVPVLPHGLKYQSVTATNDDSQMVELIRQRTVEMARYWHIPLSMVSEVSAGKSNSEQQAQDYVKYTVRPLTRRVEQAISRRLFTPDQRSRYRARLNLDSLLRGDSATQVRNGVMIRNMGAGSVNDIRTRILGWPKIDEDWANDPREPMNSNRAADTASGGQTLPQDRVETDDG